jgi:site-specific recombinase XerD
LLYFAAVRQIVGVKIMPVDVAGWAPQAQSVLARRRSRQSRTTPRCVRRTGSAPREARPHDARHTAATLLLEQGVDIRVVQEILGHSSIAVTKRYTHVTNKLSKDAAKRMGEALWG